MERTPVHQPSVSDLPPRDAWSALERDLWKECTLGRAACLPGKSDLPEDCKNDDLRVRAAFIRYLMWGGSDEEGGTHPHPKGVQIIGGWIEGRLDLEACTSSLDLTLANCRFDDPVTLQDARIGGLYLPGSFLRNGLDLHRLTTMRSVHLREGFRAEGPVDLGGARIGGKLDCGGGKFLAESDPEKTVRALNCNAAEIGASVFLRDGFEARAEVNLVRARIGGQLACDGGKFLAESDPEKTVRALNCDAAEIGADVFLRGGFEARAEVNLGGARIGGQLACDGGKFLAESDPEKTVRALNCDGAEIGADVFLRDGFEAEGLVNFFRADISGHLIVQPGEGAAPRIEAGIALAGARIGGGLFWRSVTGARRLVDLTEAKVGSLRDDWAAWDGVGKLKLDGFRYGRVAGSMSVRKRLEWLGCACKFMGRDVDVGPGFDPQPHVQLASVLRAQGDRDGAARVLVDREKRQRRAEWNRSTARLDGTWGAAGRSVLADFRGANGVLFGWLFGYGHRPMKALIWALVLIAAASLLNGIAYERGQFAPNDAVVLTSADWQGALRVAGAEGLPLPIWLESPSAQDYETFNAGLYGLDLVLPFDTLGQEAAWRASADRGAWGWWAFYTRSVFQVMGIVIAAVGAAVLTGLVGRRD